MSSFNYMDDVPVKISESYKPLPKVFQIPQAIANKLQLTPQHYHESPQYAYDFQLEKKVQAKMYDWRRMRQHEREQRRERIQRREEQRLRVLEQKHKQMLGAVSYPDAEELSSESDTDEEDRQDESSSCVEVATGKYGPLQTLGDEINFDTILQPIILPQVHAKQHARNKSNSSFNYKDFEEDTSSPFDNIELKTINDLDILAQVLQHAQLKSTDAKEDNEETQDLIAEHSISCSEAKGTQSTALNLDNALNDVVVQERNEVQLVNQHPQQNSQQQLQQHTTNIPSYFSNNIDYAHQYHVQELSKQGLYPFAANQQQQQHQQQLSSYMQHYNPQQTPQRQQQSTVPCIRTTDFNQIQQQHIYASNHNYLYSTAVCNGGDSNSSPSHNANNYAADTFVGTYDSPKQVNSTLNVMQSAEAKIKARSVPDILKELKAEVYDAEMRRVRNCSYNREQENDSKTLDDVEQMFQPTSVAPNATTPSTCYNNLEATAQTLAKNISSMGFPLERVAKIAQMFGADDKKIIEHLIPLSELIDLGFDESKISEALLRFDNNKEKALEYLIA